MASADPNGPATSVAFNAGWYSASGESESPEILDVALDRASYKPGDTAKLRIASKQGGKALVSVLSGGLLSMQEADIANGGGEIEVKVGDGLGPRRLRDGDPLPAHGGSPEAHAEPRHRRAVDRRSTSRRTRSRWR